MLQATTKRLLRPTLTRTLGLGTRHFSNTRSVLSSSGGGEEEEEEGKKGFLKSVLYGKDVNGVSIPGDNTTHSKQLARGKYVHEMQSKFYKYTGISMGLRGSFLIHKSSLRQA